MADAPQVDQKSKDAIRSMVANYGIEVPISKIEAYIEQGYGKDLDYGRTPLHTACRDGDTSAMETLLTGGAKTNVKDTMGLTAPELAFYAHGEKGLRDFIDAFGRSGQTDLPVGKRLLYETLPFPETMKQLLEVAKLDAYARRLLFCYRCAWLDIDAVRSMLAQGQDPNKGLTAEINPLWEACTSKLLWLEEVPGGFEMAYHYTKYTGHPGASSVHFDNDLLDKEGSNFWKSYLEARRKQKAQKKMVRKMRIAPDVEREVIERRIELLDVLFDAGADVALARKKLELETFGQLKGMGLGDVAAHVKQRGGGADKAPKKRKPAASTWWDLPLETGVNTEYWPDEGADGLLRLILHNVYGPVDGLTLSVRLTPDKSESDGEWHDPKPVAELVDVDGETVPRAELTEPVYEESPWEAIYELHLNKADGARVLWIRLNHKDEQQLRGELDPWEFAN